MIIDDWCKFFREMEADPSAIVHGMTIGNYIDGSEHVKVCDSCNVIVERVTANAPKEDDNTSFRVGFN